MDLWRGFQLQRQPQFALSVGQILLLGKDSPQQPMHRRIGRIEGRGRTQFLESCRLILQFVPNGAQSVVGLRPFWTEFRGRLELLQGFPVLSFVFQCQGEVVVIEGILGIYGEGLTVIRDCVVP